MAAAKARRQAQQLPVTFLIADLLYLDGRMLLDQPFQTRRALLDGLDLSGPAWRVAPSFRGGGRDVLAAAAENGMPGIVAKRLQSPYRPGERSRDRRRVPVPKTGRTD